MEPLIRQGLYDPQFEHDACGVGMICNIQGEKSHDIVQKGVEILINLDHRGACGCDADTGDGAGILIQVPDAFLREKTEELGFTLPEAGTYGVGFVFLSKEPAQQTIGKLWVEQVIRAEGQRFLGWRKVPVRSAKLGEAALATEPAMWQVFVGRGEYTLAEDFERKLFVIRKVLEKKARKAPTAGSHIFYIASLSSKTLVYKGMLTTEQLPKYFPDLSNPLMESALALVHSRFSTNTFPKWSLAHPFRYLCHNGEINTLRGNVNWMRARERHFTSEVFGDDLAKVLPILTEGDSDSATLDNALELLCHTGRELPHAMMMLIPEAWEHDLTMPEHKKAFYKYHACLMEPWDGPATIPFTDGRYFGAVLDRNGLRPSRYTITKDGFAVLASETGVLDIAPENVQEKGRLQPGRMFLVDLEEGRVVSDEEIKDRISWKQPYGAWLDAHMKSVDDLPDKVKIPSFNEEHLHREQRRFGYTLEDLKLLIGPMGDVGKEPLGSMGDDTPLAVLSERPRLLYDYFKQLFAQVTNPPLDAIREEMVTSLYTYMGFEGDLFTETPEHAHQLFLKQPILSNRDLARIRANEDPNFRTMTLSIKYDVKRDGEGLMEWLDVLCARAAHAVEEGSRLLILSDRNLGSKEAAIPALLATSAINHHLIREGLRTRCALIVESGEPREVHHFCLLLGFGASAVNPYLALETMRELAIKNRISVTSAEKAEKNYIKAIGKGILKVMSKMGISTLQSYQSAQIFEAVGLSQKLVDRYFTYTPTRIGGVGLKVISEECRMRHEHAFKTLATDEEPTLDVGGRYQWRRGGEAHQYNPMTISKLQHATQRNDPQTFEEFSSLINEHNRQRGTLRGLLEWKPVNDPVPLDEVEPWTEIVKRFKTGAMSYGSISAEAHETLAEAMNQLGGKSNTGEGGEKPERYDRDSPRRSRIKQVASGRFGVTIGYLTSADEIQIKMAQGAKPGEGGQLPGQKVYPWIAKTRHSTPYVGLISPPPHHDIYSIEDLAQLIHDLKNSNPQARINVKLVSEVGVGTIAAGVAKGKADVVLISGHDGGTGASPRTSLAHAGMPWELGLAETHQTLVHHGLRNRIIVECDGQLKTGRDVAIAAILGAQEFGFSTAPLISMGCIMMRKCHLNTCPVGIATQNPELRKKFTGTPEHVINYFHFVAEEVRQIMAQLGFRTLEEMVGRVDSLKTRTDVEHWKAKHLDLQDLLHSVETPSFLKPFDANIQDHSLEQAIDHTLIEKAKPALVRGKPVTIDLPIRNIYRTVGTMLSAEVAKRYGDAGLPDDTIQINATGSAGQSFCAFGAKGITVRISGDANDYFGKGLSGAKLIITPPEGATFNPHENIIVGNVAFYGATSGEAYIRGRVGERFCVRNSGVRAVVEGVGDHGCEYMTGGRVVVLGPTSRNFAAGMSGGVAYVLDGTHDFRAGRCNMEMVELEDVTDPADIAELKSMIENHAHYTGSTVAQWVLDNWEQALGEFIKVMPTEYRLALQRLEEERQAEQTSRRSKKKASLKQVAA